ncbi:YdcF family protein [Brevibacillus humidisoli]|uniref:YdcF family protein n=1 Tax=Brevibacillus humidisoli TaxID=2895522 RepID=UPI001E57BBF5|nr:YdcF family protein [Brevibacillus humidisoli]UFJ41554.1 YdcF family protein [Brevibacillus humidisoli]
MTWHQLLNWGKQHTWLFLVPIVLLFLWCGYVLYQIHLAERTATPRKADVAIVLGAAVWGDRPSPGLRERLDKAYWLYEQGYTPYLLVTGGVGEGTELSEAMVMKQYLTEKGVPQEKILTEDRSTSTYENLRNSLPMLEQHHFETTCIVSHGYHLARALDMAESLEINAYPVAAQTSTLNILYHKTREVLAYTKWKVDRVLLHPPF